MARDIKLNGGETSIVKAIGFGGGQLAGKHLLERLDDVIEVELLDTIDGLLSLGYILSTKVNVRSMEDIERASFRLNPAHARELKEALHPKRHNERHGRRERRG